MALTGTTIPAPSGYERVRYTSQISRTGISPADKVYCHIQDTLGGGCFFFVGGGIMINTKVMNWC